MAVREFPQGGMIGKTVAIVRKIASLKIPLYAANASFFLALSLFPALLLLLSLLRYTPLEVERLGELLGSFLPEPFLEGAEELILTTYDNASYTLVGISALTALWSASRGIYGLLTGLNGVYGLRESRSWLHKRFISALYTVAFLLVALASLGIHVFRTQLVALLTQARIPFLRFLAHLMDSQFLVLFFLQTGFFCAMFMALPNRKSTLRQVLPGAVLASLGWMVFSKGYEIYIVHFTPGSSIYGSVYAVTLALLWLYCCICILFYGGGLNVILLRRKGER